MSRIDLWFPASNPTIERRELLRDNSKLN